MTDKKGKEKSECRLKIVWDENSVSICRYHNEQTIIKTYSLKWLLNWNYELVDELKPYYLEWNPFGLDEYYEENWIGKTF